MIEPPLLHRRARAAVRSAEVDSSQFVPMQNCRWPVWAGARLPLLRGSGRQDQQLVVRFPWLLERRRRRLARRQVTAASGRERKRVTAGRRRTTDERFLGKGSSISVQ